MTAADAPALQALVEQCADYYTLVEGAPAGRDEAEKLMTELPPGRTLDDKFMFALADPMDGVLEVIRDFREPGEWYLGLLLLAPSARARRRGTNALEELIAWLEPQHATRLRLAVAEQNERALHFWKRHGFELVKRSEPRQMKARETVLLELARDL